MKYSWLKLFRKITLASIICLLAFYTISCSNNQTSDSPDTTTESPAINTSTERVEKLETPSKTVNDLPKVVKSAVLSDATKRAGTPVGKLRIIKSQKQSWADSCLGLAEPDKICAQVIVPGWKVIVSDGQNELIYRTDNKGKQVKLENL